jgi:hypothetical protein
MFPVDLVIVLLSVTLIEPDASVILTTCAGVFADAVPGSVIVVYSLMSYLHTGHLQCAPNQELNSVVLKI